MDGWAWFGVAWGARRAWAFGWLLAACVSCAADGSDDLPPLPGFEGLPLRPLSASATCEAPDLWQLAPELERSAAREVDYIADYARTGELVSEAGTACAGASQSEFCQPAFDSAIDALPGLPGSRLLLTTEGDQVRLWTVFGSPQLLGEIDTVEEAIWTALGNGYAVPCDARLSRRGDSFELDHLWWSDEFGCPPRPEGSGVRIAVTPEGEIVSDPAEEVCAPITR